MKLVPKKYAAATTWVIVALFMSMIVSGLMTYVNVGLGEHFLFAWMRSWTIAFVTVYVLSMTMVPKLRKLIEEITY